MNASKVCLRAERESISSKQINIDCFLCCPHTPALHLVPSINWMCNLNPIKQFTVFLSEFKQICIWNIWTERESIGMKVVWCQLPCSQNHNLIHSYHRIKNCLLTRAVLFLGSMVDLVFYCQVRVYGPLSSLSFQMCLLSSHCAKKPVTTVLTYPWKCTVLHCNHLGNTWKPLVLMT